MMKHRTRLLTLATLGGCLLALPGCMRAERMAYERHLSTVVAPLPAESVALGARANTPAVLAQVPTN